MEETVTVEDRFAALERRLQAAEDQLAIIRLISSYAPAVDSGTNDPASGLWVEDGVYDIGGYSRVVGRENISAQINLNQNPAILNRGYGHLLTTPQITLDGDTAQAVNYSFAFIRNERADGWALDRASANHWRLMRTADGWRVVERFNRLMDGAQIARDTLRKGVAQ
jgi:hypothetical protein